MLVLRDGYRGKHGLFRGVFPDGRLAVNVDSGSFAVAQLHLYPCEVKKADQDQRRGQRSQSRVESEKIAAVGKSHLVSK